MATVEEVARRVIGAIDSNAGVLQVSQWVAKRYRQLCSRTRLRHLRKVGELSVPANVNTGLATATRGSKVVTGDAAAQAVWTPDVVGRFFRGKVAWYEIAAVSQSELRLKSDYAEDAITAVAYDIVPRHIKLDSKARWISDRFFHPRRRRLVLSRALGILNAQAPARPRIGTGPEVWAEVGTDENGTRIVELYPYSDETELLNYVYWEIPPTLGYSESVPPQVDEHVLIEGALIDAMRWASAKAENVEKSAFWRNEYRAQATSWERNVLEAIRADRGADDVTFMFDIIGVSASGRGDIATAYDYVLENWPR